MKGPITALLIAASTVARVTDAAEPTGIEGTTIIGNRELPKALYIVPWKQAEAGGLVVRPFSSLYDQTLDPVDREVLLRRLDYFNAHDQAPHHQSGD